MVMTNGKTQNQNKMNPILKNILAVVAGIVVGSLVNMGILMISGSIAPLPEGVDPNNIDSINANIHLYEGIHFLFPFLAHALGTLAGAYLTARIAANNKMKLALVIGVFFILGGIYAAYLIKAPLWFEIMDIALAYIPMAWLGGRLATKS